MENSTPGPLALGMPYGSFIVCADILTPPMLPEKRLTLINNVAKCSLTPLEFIPLRLRAEYKKSRRSPLWHLASVTVNGSRLLDGGLGAREYVDPQTQELAEDTPEEIKHWVSSRWPVE